MSHDSPYLKRMAKPRHGQSAEKRAAKRLGARQTPASGAMEGAKGDLRKDGFLIESKATTAASLSVKLAWLAKIAKEAEDAGRVPALAIQFVDAHGGALRLGSWVMIRESTFMELIE
jgi:hypothetical protein